MLQKLIATVAPPALPVGDARESSADGSTVADAARPITESLRDIDWQSIVLEYGLPALGALVLLVLGWFFASWLGSIVVVALRRAHMEETFARFLGKLLRWTLIFFVVLGCIGLFGVDVTSFAAVIAAAGFAIGLAFQGTLASFSAGIMLLIFRPFKVGDVVNVNGQTGKVFEIDLFYTSLDTFDNRRIILPNSSVFGNTIENITYHPTRRVDVSVGTSYGDDLDAVRATLAKAIETIPQKLSDPAPQVYLNALGTSSIDWVVRVWVPTKDYWPVRDALTRAIKYALDEGGHTIPFPQMDVHLDRVDAPEE